jgi:hypothetical protein
MSFFKDNENKSDENTQKSLLSRMAGRDWWRSTVTWIRPLHQESKGQNGDSQLDDESYQFLSQKFHPFYQNLMTKDGQYKLRVIVLVVVLIIKILL